MADTDKNKVEEMLILGTGPAGLAAALYGARADLNPLLLTGTDIGGQAATTDRIENYPGFPDGVNGSELAELFQKNAERFGARLEYEVATEVDLSKRPFIVKSYGNEYRAKTLIISTGASPNKLNVPGEQEFRGKGVSYCATCDGWFFKDKNVAIVGGGDSALEEGIFLTRYASSVTIIHRREELRAGAILQKRALNNPKIKYIWNTVVKEIQGEKGVEKLLLENVKDGSTSEFPADGIFVFIGHNPNTEMFRNQLELDDKGYIITDQRMRTSIPGVFAAGEVCDPFFRQVITSAGMGAAAAISATRLLESESE
ncbi:thioredoxin-disulfide reductase [Pelolinea submarina]|uniref:Thioredoxin reductase n=1 Tax=Pelolinea submarina TaxID=913107 RepID=A0A3E0AL59_9CHLR|nr:thioredoxin-disulfide reductase [Pelolinea submarina]REG10650.1 thioredoxin reductase (NADPH) [Pelolinea submarina]